MGERSRAGAMRVPFAALVVMLAAAAAIWYGGIVLLAWRVGDNWEQLQAAMASIGSTAGWTAAGLLAAGGIAWVVGRRRRQAP